MKIKIITLLTFLFSSFTISVKAQSWGQIGAEWYYCVPYAGTAALYDYERFWIDKDTVVEDKNCYLVKSNKDSTLVFLYEEERVYLYLLDTFNLIYDYAADTGDTVIFNIPARTKKSYQIDTIVNVTGILTKIDYIKFEQDSLKYYDFTLETITGLDYLIWIYRYIYFERAGYDDEFYINLNHPSIDPVTDLRCYNDSDHTYMTEWYAELGEPCDARYNKLNRIANTGEIILTPNLSSDSFLLTINNSTNVYRTVVIDISGKQVLKKQVSGSIRFGRNFLPGIYYLSCFNLTNNDLVYVTKLIKL